MPDNDISRRKKNFSKELDAESRPE